MYGCGEAHDPVERGEDVGCPRTWTSGSDTELREVLVGPGRDESRRVWGDRLMSERRCRSMVGTGFGEDQFLRRKEETRGSFSVLSRP